MIREIRQIIAERWARERKDRAWRHARRSGPTATVDTRHGRLTVYTDDDVIGRLLYTEGEYEFDLMIRSTGTLRDAGKLPPRGHGVMLDIGANIGLTATGMLTNGEFAHVISFEPEPRNFELFQRNIAANNLDSRVTAFPLALSDSDSLVDLELSGANFGDHRVRVSRSRSPATELYDESHRHIIQVRARSLDAVMEDLPAPLHREVCLVWIDVQGHEERVFRGAPKLLSRGIPAVAELWPYGLERAGSSRDSFAALAREYWNDCWVPRGSRFIRYPVGALGALWDEFAPNDRATLLLFTR